MSVTTIQNQIEILRKEIQRHNSELAKESNNEAQKGSQIANIKKSLSSTRHEPTIRSRMQQIVRLENEIVSAQKKKADLTKKIAEATKRLHDQEARLYKAQDRQTRNLIDERDRQNRRLLESLKQLEARRRAALAQSVTSIEQTFDLDKDGGKGSLYDVFICHASEDKDDFVRPLAESLRDAGFSVWYDEFEMKWGDGLRRSIDKGLSNSRFGIVVLSPKFFEKEWPQKELDGLAAKESTGGKVILPLWHKVTKEDVLRRSPMLADRVALNTAVNTIDEIVSELSEALK